jgi:hypothetical protein
MAVVHVVMQTTRQQESPTEAPEMKFLRAAEGYRRTSDIRNQTIR